MITNIKCLKKYASIKAGFVWDNIPQFAVITGINGAGKTQLLDMINDACQRESRGKESIILSPNNDFRNQVQYIRFNHIPEDLSKDGSEILGTSQRIEDRYRRFLSYVKKDKDKRTNPDYNRFIEKLEKEHGITVDELYQKDITKVLSPELVQHTDNCFNNKFISEIFKGYKMKMSAIKEKAHDEKTFMDTEEIYKVMGFLPPWEVINSLFDKYGFTYHVTEPENSVSYSPVFVEKNKQEIVPIEFVNLSSGEKIIVSLILWAYNKNFGDKNKILLLDEFDAHLNPSMSKMFIEVVKEKLVKEFGIQVIMTTHSPSTVARVDDEDLFWLERGENISIRSKKDIISILSDGIMTYQEASGLLENVVNSTKQIIIFTEGKTDEKHILTARKKLNFSEIFDVFPIGVENGGGEDKLKQFLRSCPEALFRGKKVVGIFDSDEAGLKNKKHFKPISLDTLYVSQDNPDVFAIFIPMPNDEFIHYENGPIEFLYSKKILEKYKLLGEKIDLVKINSKYQTKTTQMNDNQYSNKNDLWFFQLDNSKKTRFADDIQELSATEFQNFKPLFKIIESISKSKVLQSEKPLNVLDLESSKILASEEINSKSEIL